MNITYEALTQTHDTVTVIIRKSEIIEWDHMCQFRTQDTSPMKFQFYRGYNTLTKYTE